MLPSAQNPPLWKRVMWKLRRSSFFYLYYLFARWLPVGNEPFGWAGTWLRRLCANELFAECGKSVTVERRAWFRSGYGVSIGNNSNIGINANINGFVHIGNDVLMGLMSSLCPETKCLAILPFLLVSKDTPSISLLSSATMFGLEPGSLYYPE